MPKNPDRPKIKFKKVGRKPPPPRLTPEQKALRAVAKVEKRHNITPSFVARMLVKHKGLLSTVAHALNMPRTTLLRYVERHDDCLEAMHTARETMGDVAEGKLYELIEAGDVRCLLYYLSTAQKHRGYVFRPGDPTDPAAPNGPVFVETVNIVGIPSGTFLPKEVAAQDNMVIEN